MGAPPRIKPFRHSRKQGLLMDETSRQFLIFYIPAVSTLSSLSLFHTLDQAGFESQTFQWKSTGLQVLLIPPGLISEGIHHHVKRRINSSQVILKNNVEHLVSFSFLIQGIANGQGACF